MGDGPGCTPLPGPSFVREGFPSLSGGTRRAGVPRGTTLPRPFPSGAAPHSFHRRIDDLEFVGRHLDDLCDLRLGHVPGDRDQRGDRSFSQPRHRRLVQGPVADPDHRHPIRGRADLSDRARRRYGRARAEGTAGAGRALRGQRGHAHRPDRTGQEPARRWRDRSGGVRQAEGQGPQLAVHGPGAPAPGPPAATRRRSAPRRRGAPEAPRRP